LLDLYGGENVAPADEEEGKKMMREGCKKKTAKLQIYMQSRTAIMQFMQLSYSRATCIHSLASGQPLVVGTIFFRVQLYSKLMGPTPKEIVEALMRFDGKETKNVKDKSGACVDKVYVKYRCPNSACMVGMVSFLEKTGFINPYNHLKACYSRGSHASIQEEKLLKMYSTVKAVPMAMEQQGLKHSRGARDTATPSPPPKRRRGGEAKERRESREVKGPGPKEIVEALMELEGKETKKMKDKSGALVDKVYLNYRCPNEDCLLRTVSFLDKTGFKNPYKHLKTCYSRGSPSNVQEEKLLEMFYQLKGIPIPMSTSPDQQQRTMLQLDSRESPEKRPSDIQPDDDLDDGLSEMEKLQRRFETAKKEREELKSILTLQKAELNKLKDELRAQKEDREEVKDMIAILRLDLNKERDARLRMQ